MKFSIIKYERLHYLSEYEFFFARNVVKIKETPISLISVEAASLVSQIKCSEDIVNAIHNRQNLANLNKKK